MQFFYIASQEKTAAGPKRARLRSYASVISSRRYVFVASRIDTELVLDGPVRVGHRLEITSSLGTVGMGHLVTYRVVATRDTGVLMRVTWVVRRLVREVVAASRLITRVAHQRAGVVFQILSCVTQVAARHRRRLATSEPRQRQREYGYASSSYSPYTHGFLQ